MFMNYPIVVVLLQARQTKSTPDGEEGKSDNVVTNNVKGSDSKVDESAQPAKKVVVVPDPCIVLAIIINVVIIILIMNCHISKVSDMGE